MRKQLEEVTVPSVESIADELDYTGDKWLLRGSELKGSTGLTDDDLKDVMTKYPNIQSLMVDLTTTVSGTGFHYLSESKITRLEIHSAQFDDRGAEAVATMKNLRRLCIFRNRLLTANGIRALAKGLPHLEHLKFRNMRLPEGAIAALAPSSLFSLDLGWAQGLTTKDFREMACLKSLKNVELACAELVDDEDARLIARLPLVSLKIEGTRITDKGLMDIASMKTLKVLRIAPSKHLSVDAIERFRQLRRDCTVEVKGPAIQAQDFLGELDL
jgi:hypothetical protein